MYGGLSLLLIAYKYNYYLKYSLCNKVYVPVVHYLLHLGLKTLNVWIATGSRFENVYLL